VTDFKLKSTVAVSPDPGRADYAPGKFQWHEAGTPLDKIPESELAQLAPEHFVDAGGSDKLPEDWRTNEATLAHDKRQAAAHKREAKQRAAAKAEANKRAEG
jgi:hypothetical protein